MILDVFLVEVKNSSCLTSEFAHEVPNPGLRSNTTLHKSESKWNIQKKKIFISLDGTSTDMSLV